MAKYIAILVSLIFLVFSVNSVVHGQKTEDPSEEIIKKEDAEEGYNFLQLKDIEDNVDNEKKSKPVQDDLPIYPLQDKDNPQCPDPTPIRGTMRVLHGHPFSYGCNVLLTCDPGLVFEDGKSAWNLTCLGLSVLPPKCVWVPMHDGKPTCKDELQCPDPSPVRGTVKVISGKPYTDGCKASLRCDPGLVFNDGKTVWNLTCVPVPHIPPALVWIPQFNGTPTCKEPDLTESSKTIAESEKQETAQTDNKDDEVLNDPETGEEQQTIVSRDVNDDLQCPDPTPVRGTMKILHGQPYSFACNVLLTCDTGLVFPNGESVWNLTCLAIPVTPPALVWVPVNLGKPVCKDSPQCPDPTPVRGTLKVLSGTPYSDGCNVLLTCDPGLVFADGKSVWNLSCTPLPVLPNKCIWLPQYDGKPTCKEPEETENSLPKEATELHEGETNSEPQNTYDEVVKNDITDTDTTDGNEDNVNNLEIDTYGPEEDLDGTFHENYIEYRDNVETNIGGMNDKNDEIVVPSEWEENEEFTNAVSGSESKPDYIEMYDEIINNHDNERTEYEDSFMENDNSNGKNLLETSSEVEQNTPSEQTNEIANLNEEDSEDLENETENDFSEHETPIEVESYQTFPEIEENTMEESDSFENYETEELHNISDEETEKQQINGEVGAQEETEEENEGNEEAEIGEEYKSAIEVGKNEEEEEEANKEDIEAEMGEEEEETENEEGEQNGKEYENEGLQEIEKGESNEDIETENEEEVEEQEQNNEEYEGEEEKEEEEEIEAETEENMKLENDEENEEEAEDEEESDLFDEVHPLQPPSIKQPSIIYAALQESSLFDKEENEEETEEINSDNLIFGEVEPPGSLLDIQMVPVEASKEQIQTNENDCSLPAETGPCRAYFRRFFFNSKSGECDVFVYGGCQGNGNNFKTSDDCINTCVRKIVNL